MIVAAIDPDNADRGAGEGGTLFGLPRACSQLAGPVYGVFSSSEIDRGGRQVVTIASVEEVGPTPVPKKDVKKADLPARPPLAVVPFDQATAKLHQRKWADHLGKNVVETNSIGMKFALVPPGSFVMGSPASDRRPHEAEHEVEITKPYFPVSTRSRAREYEKVTGSNPSSHAATGDRRNDVEGIDTQRFPVDAVLWPAAVRFCARLSELPEESKSGRRYRLPTEAEWEFACRAGRAGNDAVDYPEEKLTLPTVVTLGRRNSFGLVGMHGSMYEWCQDWFAPYSPRRVVDPKGPETGVERIARGTVWSDGPGNEFCPPLACRWRPAPEARQGRHSFCVGSAGW